MPKTAEPAPAKKTRNQRKTYGSHKSGNGNLAYTREQFRDLINGLGMIQATHRECAAMLKISESTLHTYFTQWPDTKASYEEGLEVGKVSMKRAQFRSGMQGNVTAQIWWGKQHMGQRDFSHITNSGVIDHRHTLLAMVLKDVDAGNRSLLPALDQQALPQASLAPPGAES